MEYMLHHYIIFICLMSHHGEPSFAGRVLKAECLIVHDVKKV